MRQNKANGRYGLQPPVIADVGNKNMNEKEHKTLKHLTCGVWALVLMVFIATVGGAALLYQAVLTITSAMNNTSDYSTVVVARTNILSGTVLTKELLASARVHDGMLPKHYACRHSATFLLGATVTTNFTRGTPIDCSMTDKWKRESSQQDRD